MSTATTGHFPFWIPSTRSFSCYIWSLWIELIQSQYQWYQIFHGFNQVFWFQFFRKLFVKSTEMQGKIDRRLCESLNITWGYLYLKYRVKGIVSGLQYHKYLSFSNLKIYILKSAAIKYSRLLSSVFPQVTFFIKGSLMGNHWKGRH